MNLFRPLSEEVKHCVRFESEVANIDYTNSEVVITLVGGETLKCEHVVTTIPLGVVKENHATLFTPPLPERKLSAIERTGFGKSGKVFLEFERAFWQRGEEGIKIAWGKERILGQKLPRDWYVSVLGFDELHPESNVLICWIGGQATQVMESLSDDQLKRDLGNVIRDVTGDISLPDPIRVTKTQWASDRLYRGSYSYPAIKSDFPRDLNDLAEPILSGESNIPLVLFAGEATHPTAYSTVHGARLTGLREADRIIQFHKQKE